MLRQINLCASWLLAALLTGCGAPGVPLPPSLEIPEPVADLHASRKGDEVHLTWSQPVATTERQNLRRGGTTDVCRAVGPLIKTCGTPVVQIPFQALPRDSTAQQRLVSYTDHLSPISQVSPTAAYIYALIVLNPYGRGAGFSNEVAVPAAPTLPAPGNFRYTLTGDGVRLSWSRVAAPEIPGLRFVYHVYRQEPGTSHPVLVGELPVEDQPAPTLLDGSFEWEKTYDYYANVVTFVSPPNGQQEQVEGADTSLLRVFAHDVFPPATPTGVQAAFSGPGQKPFIDLVWTPDAEPDLAGYNVYRRNSNGEWVKINPAPLKTPAFRDTNVLPGREYSYSVSAVDVRGNESPRSAEVTDTVPNESGQ
jgi:hypothetical protein